MLDADEAVVLDMGQYEVPTPPQKVASMRNANASLRQSLKIVWPQMLQPTTAADPASAPASGVQESDPEAAAAPAAGYLLQPTSSLPGAVPLACSSSGYGYAHPQRGSAGGADSSSGANSVGPRQRVRLVQILAPSLVGRAAVWGNQLSLKSSWVCCDAPYYEAPGENCSRNVCYCANCGVCNALLLLVHRPRLYIECAAVQVQAGHGQGSK
jgi:hypothetical protein